MNDTRSSSAGSHYTWLRRSAIVMALAASAVGVVMAVWFAIVTWRAGDGRPNRYSIVASLLVFGVTNLLGAAKIRDGEIRSPLRLAFACIVCAVLIAMMFKTAVLLMHIGQG